MIVDKLLVLVSLFMLVVVGIIGGWFLVVVIIILCWEILVLGLCEFLVEL